MIDTSFPECDILHLAFGGLGGHRAVVEELSKSVHLGGLRSGVLYVLPADETQCPPKAFGLDFVEHVRIKHRSDLSSMHGVVRAVLKRRPKCVIAHTHRHIPAAWLGLVLSRTRPKIVLVEHLSVSLRAPIDEVQSILGAFFSKAVVFLSKDYALQYRLRFLLRLLRKPTAVIPNGIEIPTPTTTQKSSDSGFTIGMASRLIPSKKVANLIEATKILCAQGNGKNCDWLLRIAGNGPNRGGLEALVVARDLTSTVRFDGPLDRSEMADWYRSLSCYVHISDGETMSMSVLEAASHGLPILASDDLSVRQVFIPNKNIVLLPSSNPDVIAATLSHLRHSAELCQLGAAAREVIRNNFSNDSMAVGYLQLLSEVKVLPSEITLQAIAKISERG